jgi:hypothetical protein
MAVCSTRFDGDLLDSQGAHHGDLRGSNVNDTVSMQRARVTERKILDLWLQNAREQRRRRSARK